MDQFLSSGLSKWGLTTRLTLLLPHGYEGQGPEHSSARLERFLQLAAEGNLRIANPTTPAQYFHLLRRQARRTRQRPLVVMTPKSLLRLPQAGSRLDDLAYGAWRAGARRSLRGAAARQSKRVIFCSGKIYYDLLAEAEKMERPSRRSSGWSSCTPSPGPRLAQVLAGYPSVEELVWVQEEPRNMGAWTYVEPKLREIAAEGVEVSYVGRPERASPAEGYPAAHIAEQGRIVREALGAGRSGAEGSARHGSRRGRRKGLKNKRGRP